MRHASLADWLGWLEQSHPKEIDLGLTRIRQVAERLQLLNPAAKTIIVAGTNGKGSCVAACAALLQSAHYSVGIYTSPHLLHYAERIQVNGKAVSDVEICNAFEKIAVAADVAAISLTYFEYGTLAALEIFKQRNVDFMVLEVGLGGRLDAINIIDADVAIITSIALDHQAWLGDTRELIGREKAGILRAHKIFICADESPPQSILAVAAELKTHTYLLGRDFSYGVDAKKWQWQGKSNQGDIVSFSDLAAPHLPLPSVVAALQAIYLLDIKLDLAVIETTLASLTLAGRFQKIIFRNREFILDVAHNPAATEYFARRLENEPCAGKTHAIVAMMADKDCAASLANLVGLVDTWYLLDLTNIPRAATPKALTEKLMALDLKVKALDNNAGYNGDINAIMHRLLNASDAGDRVIVFGSFYTVAAALFYLQANTELCDVN
ncbi:MAG: bifunctional tetrahydrofolate synthase/dihydrofolate synthase [Pseudomonadota bacterium]